MEECNQPLEKLSPSFIRKHIKAVTFDIDGVVLKSGTYLRESMDGTKLLIKTHKFSPRMVNLLTSLKKHLWINFSSGRSLLYLQYILGDILWEKVILQSENGNFILMNGKIQQLASYTQGYFQKLNNIRKDLIKLKTRMPKKIFGFEPKHVIITIHALHPVSEIEKIVKKHDPENELYCLWARVAYDIGSKETTKKTGIHALCKILKIQPSQMIMTGNDQNDREMLDFGVGVTVDPKNVSGTYAIRPQRGTLGGEVLAEYLLSAFHNHE